MATTPSENSAFRSLLKQRIAAIFLRVFALAQTRNIFFNYFGNDTGYYNGSGNISRVGGV